MFSSRSPSLLKRLSGSWLKDDDARPAYARRESWTSFQGSMARETATSRWPSIVSGMVNELEDLLLELTSQQGTEGRAIIQKLISIKTEIECNGELAPLKRDSESGGDVDHINRRLASYKRRLTWQNSPYLLTECYLYRRVQTIFDRSKYWRGFDVFQRQKELALSSSRYAIEELASLYMTGNIELGPLEPTNAAQKTLFTTMTQIALWGDAVEIPSVENIKQGAVQPLAGLASIHAKRENVVDDDTNATWKYLSTRSRQNRRIDIVLGNAGFGLFADIVYGAYLLQSGLASLVVFHVKDIPWYVDNPTVKDFQGTLHQLGQEDLFPTRQHLDPLLKRIQGYLSSGTMALRSHSFWTTAFGFPEMEKQAPALLRGLRASSLVIFKGDYNYRKLTAGLQWPHTTSFSEAIGALGAGSGLRILSLRANKADVCVGVKPEVIDRLDEENPNREWVRNGKYAVISFSDGADRRLWVE